MSADLYKINEELTLNGGEEVDYWVIANLKIDKGYSKRGDAYPNSAKEREAEK